MLKQKPPRSLVQRIMLSFALLVTLIATIYAAALHQSIEFTESHLIANFLDDELDRVCNILDRGDIPITSNHTFLYGPPPLNPIPSQFKGIKSGFSELLDQGDYFVYQGTWKNQPILIVRDQEGFEETERTFKSLVIISVILVCLIGLLAGWWLSRNIMYPVKELSAAVRQASLAPTYQPLSVNLTQDEVGELALICDRALQRLHDALLREKAFTGDVSHELRTPLTVIKTSLELLYLSPLSPSQKKQVDRIARSAENMREMVNLFLSLARQSQTSAQTQPDTLEGILKNAYLHWLPFAKEKGLDLQLRVEQHCPGTFSPIMVGTVINNLLQNAVQYTQVGQIIVTENANGFCVSDTGPGVDSDEARHIFEPGMRGRASSKLDGAGLGLSIVARICQRMNWQVSVISKHEGACFDVRVTGDKKTIVKTR